MPRSRFKCPRCTRSFSMKAHLARHMNTIHASGTRRKVAGGRGRKRKLGRRGALRAGRHLLGPRVTLDGVSRVVTDMRTCHADLLAERANLNAQIDALETAIHTMGGTAPRKRGRPAGRRATGRRRGGRGRAGRAGSLKNLVVQVLRQRSGPMSPNEISDAVVKAGYQSRAKDLTKAVSNVLPTINNVKKVGFGSYTV